MGPGFLATQAAKRARKEGKLAKSTVAKLSAQLALRPKDTNLKARLAKAKARLGKVDIKAKQAARKAKKDTSRATRSLRAKAAKAAQKANKLKRRLDKVR